MKNKKRISLTHYLPLKNESLFSLSRIILMIVVLILGIVLIIKRPVKPEKPSLIFQNSDKIDKIKWEHSGIKWEIKKDNNNNNWLLLNENKYVKAKNEIIFQIINSFSKLEGVPYNGVLKKEKLYGKMNIKTPKGVISLSFYRGKNVILVYKDKKWSLVRLNLDEIFPSHESLIDLTLFNFKPENVYKIDIPVITPGGKKQYVFVEKNQKWKLQGEKTIISNRKNILKLLKQMKDFQFKYLLTSKIKKSSSLKWKIFLKNKTTIILEVFNEGCLKSEVAIKKFTNKNHNFSACISKKLIKQITPPLPKLLEARLIAPLKSKIYDEIQFKSIKGDNFKLIKKNSIWSVHFKGKVFPGDELIIKNWLKIWSGILFSKVSYENIKVDYQHEIIVKNEYGSQSVKLAGGDKFSYGKREGEDILIKISNNIVKNFPSSHMLFKSHRVFKSKIVKSLKREGLGLSEIIQLNDKDQFNVLRPLDIPLDETTLKLVFKILPNLRAISFKPPPERIIKPPVEEDKDKKLLKLLEKNKITDIKIEKPIKLPSKYDFIKAKQLIFHITFKNNQKHKLYVKTNIPYCKLEKGSVSKGWFKISKEIHKLFTKPWCTTYLFSWSLDKTNKILWQTPKGSWELKKEIDFWLYKSKNKKILLQEKTINNYLNILSKLFNKLQPIAYNSLKHSNYAYLSFISNYGMTQRFTIIKIKDGFILNPYKFKVLYFLPDEIPMPLLKTKLKKKINRKN
jgi:hypothetical protein